MHRDVFIRKEKPWILLLVLLVGSPLFSLGPILHWKSEPFFSWMPYRIIAELPIVSLMRLPHRWLVVSSFLFALLASREEKDLFFYGVC